MPHGGGRMEIHMENKYERRDPNDQNETTPSDREGRRFQYTYSAKEQDEITRIRAKYQPQETDKMERLHRLDRSATRRAQIIALILGILGTLVLGIGMSFVMTDMADALSWTPSTATVIGIATGLVGILLVSVAYPCYRAVAKRDREKIAPEILRLTDELMK